MTSISRTNQEWITQLEGTGEAQAQAIDDLHRLLLRSVSYTFSKYMPTAPHPELVRMQAEDCAQDALLTLLDHLHEFRGESQFTTWAYKFGINKAITTARRQQWQGVSLEDLAGEREPDELSWQPAPGASIEQIQAQKETWEIVHQVIQRELTERQRQVLIWMVFDEVPMDVVTERLNTNRNAVYKLLHDARQKVKSQLEGRGYTFEEILHLFAQG